MIYKMITRDWKGSYSENKPKGWYVFATEDKIQTGQDSYAMIFCNSKLTPKEHTPQVIYDVIEAIECGEDIEGFEYMDQYTVEFGYKTTEGNKVKCPNCQSEMKYIGHGHNYVSIDESKPISIKNSKPVINEYYACKFCGFGGDRGINKNELSNLTTEGNKNKVSKNG